MSASAFIWRLPRYPGRSTIGRPSTGVALFRDRRDAGRRLAMELGEYDDDTNAVVVGLPRGGVPVASEVASALDIELDVIVVRKLGVPFRPELAMGAIGEGGVRVVDHAIVRAAGVTPEELGAVESRERSELEARARRFRSIRSSVPLAGRTVIVVDDGVATGATARAACEVAAAAGARRVVLAVPVAPPGWQQRLDGAADEFVAVDTPARFDAVGAFYRDFAPTTDDQVASRLRSVASRRRPSRSSGSNPGHRDAARGDDDG